MNSLSYSQSYLLKHDNCRWLLFTYPLLERLKDIFCLKTFENFCQMRQKKSFLVITLKSGNCWLDIRLLSSSQRDLVFVWKSKIGDGVSTLAGTILIDFVIVIVIVFVIVIVLGRQVHSFGATTNVLLLDMLVSALTSLEAISNWEVFALALQLMFTTSRWTVGQTAENWQFRDWLGPR